MFRALKTTFSTSRAFVSQRRALAQNAFNTAPRAFFCQGPKVEQSATSNTDNVQAQQTIKPDPQVQNKVNEQAQEKMGLKDTIAQKVPFLGKVADFVVDSIRETFPSDQYTAKAEKVRMQAKLDAEKEKMKKEYSEEELTNIQGEIPEWKRTAMAQYVETNEEDSSMTSKVTNKLKEKFNETEFANYIYKSDQYKEYLDFKKEMSQFKEDYKDHLSQSQNPALIASMTLYNKATSESSTSMAIREMRKYVKGFDVFDLERDVRGIFCDVFDAYLRGDLVYIEKTCEDMGLAYFKTLLKKREVDGVLPKRTEVWESEPAEFVGGKINERNLPSFTYSVRIQELHCNISKKTNKIVDGAEDSLLQHRFNIVLTPHENPDLETVGHRWSIVEVMPVEATPLLA